MRAIILTALLAALACATIAKPPLKSTASSSTDVLLDVPPRYMWGWGPGLHGYCGAFSFQSFLLLFGNYVTAEQIRAASDSDELLVAVNADTAAKTLKVKYEEWAWQSNSIPQAQGLMSWAATHIDQGHGVIGTFYEQLVSGGDEDYDHIMPIFGYKKDLSSPLKKGGDRDDVLGIFYNDLFRDYSLYGPNNSTFIKDRKRCVPANGVQPKAAPYDFCLPSEMDYAIALLGNVDDFSETYPTKLIMPSWTEPDWGAEDARHEAIVDFTVTVVITGLQPGVEYSLLRFDSTDLLPTRKFIQGGYSNRWNFVAEDTIHKMKDFDKFRSDSTIFYRTVINA